MISRELQCYAVGINSIDKEKNLYGESAYGVGWNRSRAEYRMLIEIALVCIPQDAQITEAELFLSTREARRLLLKGYPILEPWDLRKVCWLTQPEIEPSCFLFCDYVDAYHAYRFDLTSQINIWMKSPETNHGILLAGMYEGRYAYANIEAKQAGAESIRLRIHYMSSGEEHETVTYQYRENIEISHGGLFHTTPRDLSKSVQRIFFVKNNTQAEITVSLELSPDCTNYYEEMLLIPIAPGKEAMLEPIHYCRYARIMIQTPPDLEKGLVQTWLDVKE